MPRKLTKRQIALGGALVLTLIAAIFAPPKEQEELVASKTVRAAEAVKDVSRRPVAIDTYAVIEKRLWPTEKSHDLFPVKFKPPPLPPSHIAQLQAPPPKPTAPPLPFVYIGKVLEEDKLTVFVSKQEKNYLLKGGEVIDGMYRVDKVETDQVSFTYLPLAAEQVMSIRGKD